MRPQSAGVTGGVQSDCRRAVNDEIARPRRRSRTDLRVVGLDDLVPVAYRQSYLSKCRSWTRVPAHSPSYSTIAPWSYQVPGSQYWVMVIDADIKEVGGCARLGERGVIGMITLRGALYIRNGRACWT